MHVSLRATRFLILAGLTAAAAPALAIDCGKASSPVEKLICSSREAKAEDAGLNRAYAALMKQAPDDEIRAMLKDSQRRWLAARDGKLQDLIANIDAVPEGKTAGSVAADLISARIDALTERDKGSKQPRLISTALAQREFRRQFTGGPYDGYDVVCELLPPNDIYACFAISHYQNKDRVCTAEQYWATGSVYAQRYVAKVVDQKLVPVASCSYNGNDDNCPGGISDEARWNTGPKVRTPMGYPTKPLPRLDGEVYDSDDYDWLKACLTDDTFPLANPTTAGR